MPRHTTAAALAVALLTGCNQYELFRVSGFAQESFSNDAEILFVIDNSPSMQDEAEALALNFDVFIEQLAEGSGSENRDGLDDAVDGYIGYVNQRSAFLDFQLGITTTSVEDTYGALYGADPVIKLGEDDIASRFRTNLLCNAVAFNELSLDSDPSYECGDPLGETVTRQYLDCVCGPGNWEDNNGSGAEEGLEAVYMNMCRGAADPPDACYEQNQFTAADEGSAADLYRDDSTLVVIVVTDEGDTSRRMAQGDGDPDEYQELFDQFFRRQAWAVIGPTTENCNTGSATTWGVARYNYFVEETNGRYFDIAEADGSGGCQVSDFATALEELGQLLNNLLEAFPLASIPDVDSILVFVDGEEVDRAEEMEDDQGVVSYGDGWSYLPEENAVEFHGGAIPDYNADVRIYYRPLEGMPKELPW